jgi:hypothetical protein
LLRSAASQALKCNTNKCPTGIATQDEALMSGLVVPTKALRVANYQRQTVHTALEIIGAIGLNDPQLLRPNFIYKRTSQSEVMSYEEQYPSVADGSLLAGGTLVGNCSKLQRSWDMAESIVKQAHDGSHSQFQ